LADEIYPAIPSPGGAVSGAKTSSASSTQADFGEAISIIGGVERKIHFFAFDFLRAVPRQALGWQRHSRAQPTGYPVYRLEWQEIGSLQRRLRKCLIGMRAEPYPDGGIEYVELELYMTWRANGLRIETPAVRP
jgi:hypothetical protein